MICNNQPTLNSCAFFSIPALQGVISQTNAVRRAGVSMSSEVPDPALDAGGPAPPPTLEKWRVSEKTAVADRAVGPRVYTDHSQRISVIIATAFRETTLMHTLETLARQTHPPDEVVVVDGGSAPGVERAVATKAS